MTDRETHEPDTDDRRASPPADGDLADDSAMHGVGSDAFGGASSPEPSLVARIAQSGAEAAAVYDEGASPEMSAGRPSNPAPDEDAGQRLTEGSPTAPRDGRVDAAAATLGPHAGEPGSFAAGEGISSVGGAQGDSPGSGIADQPEAEPPQERAGFLEGEGGRRGVSTTAGEIFDDMGGTLRSAAEVAADSAEPDGAKDAGG